MTGPFITIDGPGGSGKTATVAALAGELRQRGHAVILTASPEIIPARLDQRGRHDRFEHDPGAASIETALFRDASATLAGLGVPVIQIDTGSLSPQQAASQIADALAVHCASLSEHG